jgi:ubiquinone/menaquinone biosynthesis C-methylase UbiE
MRAKQAFSIAENEGRGKNGVAVHAKLWYTGLMAQELFLDDPMPDVIEQWRFYLSVLCPSNDDAILDVGCNTGDAERLLLREYPTVGKVVGVEIRSHAIRQAVETWRRDGQPPQIEFRLADGQSLPFLDSAFDRALCVETLEYVNSPALALQEIRRILTSKGSAVIVHTDFDTQVFNAADKALSRKIVAAFSDAGPNGQMGRELHGLCRQAGFRTVEPLTYILVNTEWRPTLYAYKIAQTMADWLRSGSLVGDDEIGQWLADIEAQASEGNFFYSVNRYVCRCVK